MKIPPAVWASTLFCGCVALGLFVVTASGREAARKKVSQQRVEEITKALTRWRQVERRCPATRVELVARRFVQASVLEDAWGTRIEYRCSERGLDVRSAGRDRVFNTIDDITRETLRAGDERR
jgi:hypothetical protein